MEAHRRAADQARGLKPEGRVEEADHRAARQWRAAMRVDRGDRFAAEQDLDELIGRHGEPAEGREIPRERPVAVDEGPERGVRRRAMTAHAMRHSKRAATIGDPFIKPPPPG